MSDQWLFLVKRYGQEIPSPSIAELNDAVSELFAETIPDMTEADYAEHGSAHLRRGQDDGPMYVVEIARHGIAKLEEWADQDYEKEICPAQTMHVSKLEAIELWSLLANGSIDKVRDVFRSAS